MLEQTKYYYFAKHTFNETITKRLRVATEAATFTEKEKELLLKFVSFFNTSPKDLSAHFIAERFIELHKEEFKNLIQLKGFNLKYFLTDYLGFELGWGSSAKGYGSGSRERADAITEEFLLKEMTSKKGTIYPLLEAAGFDVKRVKTFLPAVMLSIDSNTRDKEVMEFEHTGRFSFDFDGFSDTESALALMEEVWKGTENIRPYLAFLSPRGKGFKIFAKVNILDPHFQIDFEDKSRENLMKYHKRWYEGARREIVTTFPELEERFDLSTTDPQRLTFIPFIQNSVKHLKYNTSRFSSYSIIRNKQKAVEEAEMKARMVRYSNEIADLMKDQGIKTAEDAYYMVLKNKRGDFNIELETDKFVACVDKLCELINTDDRVAIWASQKFDDYQTLNKLSWVLYACFGDLGVEQLTRLVPPNSNKLDESSTDSRWMLRSRENYTEEQLNNTHPGAFYNVVKEIGEIKDFLLTNYAIDSHNANTLLNLNKQYETYEKNRILAEDESDNSNLSEFLDNITEFLEKPKPMLPMIKELSELEAVVDLGPKEYLNSTVMEDIYQNKFPGKRIYHLRSQCGTGKNSQVNLDIARLKGSIILAEPFTSIMSQAAAEAWREDKKDSKKIFSNSSIETTLRNFKKVDTESLRVNYETSLRGVDLSLAETINCTYNQLLNISYDDLAKRDYIFIDECHVISTDLSYRADVISAMLNYLIEFVAKKPNAKTKIIFMTGTPSVEVIAIHEIMKDYGIGDKFQRLIVNKKYEKRPIVHLTHLDTLDYQERQDAVIDKMNEYLKQGRKVCHIFNNKGNMDQYIREIQSKLSPEIKVGLFYSGSTGEATNNILMGYFGKYDVVLCTNFFINGINIERDGLTEEEIEAGKKSNQKYGMIIDLGQSHTKLNALDGIQALNRFRNRLVHTTVFLPKIFKPLEGKKFDLKHAAKVVRGINMFNYGYLTGSNTEEFQNLEEERDPMMHLVEKIRRNPLSVSMMDLNAASKKEASRVRIVSMMNSYLKIYDDWFYSLEGYFHLCTDAGLKPIVKHMSKKIELDELNEEHEAIENAVIESFLNNDAALEYLTNQIEPDKRILVKASNAITDPLSKVVDNFRVEQLINDKYIIIGDFHPSHERAINQIVRAHLNLSYWYGTDKAMELFRYLLDSRITITPSESSHYATLIKDYLVSCKKATPRKLSVAYTYVRALEELSQRVKGIDRFETETSISYVVQDQLLSENIIDSFTEMLYDSTIWKIKNSDSKEKEELLEYYSNKELMKAYDKKELKFALNEIGLYKPARFNDKGQQTSPEQLHITKVLYSDKLSKASYDFDTSKWMEPKHMDYEKFGERVKLFNNNKRSLVARGLERLKDSIDSSDKSLSELTSLLTKYKLTDCDIKQDLEVWYQRFKDTLVIKQVEEFAYIIKTLNDNKDLIYNTFELCEYLNYKEALIHKRLPSMDNLFFTRRDFELSELEPNIEIDNFNRVAIYHQIKQLLNEGEVPKYDQRYWIAFNNSGIPVVVRKTRDDFARAVVEYAYSDKGDDFMLSSGAPNKQFNKGIYNVSTFSRDYLKNTFAERNITNYTFNNILVDHKDLENYILNI